MWTVFISTTMLIFVIEQSTSLTRQTAAARNFYQDLRRKTLDQVRGRTRFNVAPHYTPQIQRTSMAQLRNRMIHPMPRPLERKAPLRRAFYPARVPVRRYLAPIRRYPIVIPGKVRVAPAIKRTRPASPRGYLRQSLIRRPVRPAVRYVVPIKRPLAQRILKPRLAAARRVSVRIPYRQVMQHQRLGISPNLRARAGVVRQRLPVARRAYRPHVIVRLKAPAPSMVHRTAPFQQRFAVYHPIPRRYNARVSVRRPAVLPQQRQSVPYLDKQKSIRDRMRNAIMWKKYLRAEGNPYANQIARRISYQALRRTTQPRKLYHPQIIAKQQSPYVRGFKPLGPINRKPLRRQMQTSYNTQYSVGGTSSNSGTNSNTVLKGPGQTQTNNHVKVTQNTGVRGYMPRTPREMSKYYRQRAQALHNRQLASSAKANAKAKAKASAGTSAMSSSGSTSAPANPPSRTSPPQGRGGSGGYGFGAGYGWGSSGGGGFGYGGGGANGYPSISFPFGFGGFPYIPGYGGSGTSGQTNGGSPQNKYAQNRKKKVAPQQKGKQINAAYRPPPAQRKPIKTVSRRPKVGPAKVNFSARDLPRNQALGFMER